MVSRLLVLGLTVGGLSILSTGTAHAAITGGDVRVVGDTVVHVFEGDGVLTVPAGMGGFAVEYLAIAGGGGGGGSDTLNRAAGGGGAGGTAEGTFVAIPGATYSITIGAGGQGGEPGAVGQDGGGTTIGSVTALHGGGGGGAGRSSGTIRDGRDGGSGGGAGAQGSSGRALDGGAYGHGGASLSHQISAGGGGGAGGPASGAGAYGPGGAGWSSALAASYGLAAAGVAGGGSGGGWSFGGVASHGGGQGGSHTALPGGDATSYGSGGGGAGTNSDVVDAPGGNGHAGVVVIRYPLENLPKLVNTVAPQISGDIVDGATLTVTDGTWDDTVTATAYRWERCDTAGDSCQAIGGATSNSHTLGLGDIGRRLRATVTASPVLGVDVEATSELTGVVAAKDVTAGTPSISGIPRYGQTLTANPGAWSGSGTIRFTYQWQRQTDATWEPITGAGAAAYGLGLDDIGHAIRVAVTGAPTAGDPVTVTTDPTGLVALLALTAGSPTVSGTPQHGQTLIVDPDAAGWHGSGDVTFDITWQRCDTDDCVSIGTEPTHLVGFDDIGHTIQAQVTGTPAHGDAVTVTTAPTAVVSPANVTPGTPAISGVAQHSQILTASPGTWSGSGAITFTYQWHRGGGSTTSPIPGATNATYLLGLDDIGQQLRVHVTGTPTAGDPVSVSSALTGQVHPLVTTSGSPTLSGTAQHGQTLTVDVDEAGWHGSGDMTFEIVWLRCDTDGCTPIGTGPTHVLAFDDIGHTIRAQVTGTPSHGPPARVTTPTGPVEPKIVTSVVPEVIGFAIDGGVLHVTDPSVGWDGSGELTFTYQWLRCDSAGDSCTPVADGSSYTLQVADIGHTIRFEITGAPEAGDPVAERSLTTAVVVPADVTAGTPTVSGLARDGNTLTAEPDADGWSGSGGFTFTYQWQRQVDSTWRPITDATGSTYALAADDIGHLVRVMITGTPDHGDPVTVASNSTGTVGPRDVVAGSVTITGTAQVAQTLTAHVDAPTWDSSSPLTFDAVWWRCLSGNCVQIGEGNTHVLTVDDLDATIRVDVTGTDAWGDTATVSSTTTGPVVGVDEPAVTVPGADAGAPVTDQITVTGTQFLPHSRAQVWLHSDPILLGEVTISADGTFTNTFTLPPGIRGDHTIVVLGTGLDSRPRTLTSPVTIADTSSGADDSGADGGSADQSSGDLPVTGTSTTSLMWVSLIAMLLGTALIRRRQRG